MGMASLRHDTMAMEKFAEKAHWVWAFASLAQALISVALAWMFYPFAMYALGAIGQYAFGLLLCLYAQVILGFGGTVFHVLGAQDHIRNQAKLKVTDICCGKCHGE